MSVIIRLQNLPWSANAADIRQYFHGLAIPEGGVHIVGGQLGDAFIAFSTDEDARQAMALDGGMLKDSRIKLFLSSRTEMQKIIEQARQQQLALQGIVAANVPVNNTFPSAAATAPNSAAVAIPPQPFNRHVNQPMDMGVGLQHGSHPGHGMHPHPPQQQHQPFGGPNQGLAPNQGPHPPRPGFPPTMDAHPPAYGANGPPHHGPHNQHFGGHIPNGPGGPQQHGPIGFGGHVNGPPDGLGDRGGPRDGHMMRNGPPDQDRIHERAGRDRGPRERDRSRDRNRRDRSHERRRGGRRSRSRSRSRGRDRPRHRSRSSSRERRRSRDRNGKTKANPSGLLPVPADEQEHGGPPGPRKPESNTAIQLRMLTGELTYRDIRQYLEGINIPNTCIKMINGLDGYRFGLAYIRFTLQSDKQKALGRNNGFIRGSPVQVCHVEDAAFLQAVDSFAPGISDIKNLPPSCLAFRDFPPMATEQNLREALGSVAVTYVLIERDENGCGTGLCYAQLASEIEARKSMQVLRNGLMVTGRPVKAAWLPLEELESRRRALEMKFHGGPEEGPLSPSAPRRPSGFTDGGPNNGNANFDPARSGPNARAGSRRVFITGLPPSAMERDVGDFFSDVGVIPQHIDLVTDDNRMPTGEAYCTFASVQEAERALDKNGGFLSGHTVKVAMEMDPAAANHPVPGPPAANMHPNEEINYNQYNPSQPGPRMYGPGGGGPGGPYMPPNRPMMGGGRGSRFGGPPMNRYPPGPPSGGPGYMGPRPPVNNYRMRMPIGGPGGPGGPGPVGPGGPGGPGGPVGSPTPNFGAPGCVVALSNVPHKAVIADILEFFRGYNVNEKCVMRRFGPNGEPTGDARVSFRTPEEAQMAVQALQNEFMLNRRVLLSII